MSIGEAVGAGVFALWFLVSIAGQLPIALQRRLRRHDAFGLVPQWTFFAPRPGVTDVHLLYRDWAGDRTVGPWREIHLRTARRWWHCLWNPNKRAKKALLDMSQELAAAARVLSPIAVQGSMPYLLALAFVSRQPHAPGTELTQFMLMRSPGTLRQAEAQPVFVSARHRP